MRDRTEALAAANPNIALIKYWGKADAQLIIPANSSLSLTLDVFPTTTRVVRDPELSQDEFLLNDVPMEPKIESRVRTFIDLLRERSGDHSRVLVDSTNTVPTGAGLASSASGFAALATAAAHAFGLDLDRRGLSRLARRGSGSASRSLFDGLVVWNAGSDDETSYAEAIDNGGLELGMVIVVINPKEKSVTSRDAMQRTVDTSPFFSNWVTTAEADLKEMRQAIERGDFTTVGEITERNSLAMHATMMSARPPVRYISAESVTALDAVIELRGYGIEAYSTMDAGPNVKVLTQLKDRGRVAGILREKMPEAKIIEAGSGTGARLLP